MRDFENWGSLPPLSKIHIKMPNRTNDQDHRPSPEALLAAAKQEGRGRLKIFLGAAPGVGKTYSMLEAAQVRKREGVDLVLGVVETHGRPETEELLQDLEIVPRRQIEYRGKVLEEMDLDAILARRPLRHLNAYLGSTLAVVLAGLIAKLIELFLPLPNLSIVFLTAVLFSAVTWGLWPAIFAAILSMLVYDFGFVPPMYTLTVPNP